MFKTLRTAWRVPTLRQKILFTLMVVVVFRLGNAITIPFINVDLLKTQISIMGTSLLGMYNIMSGGAFSTAKLFALGVQPYINASIIIQLLCVAIPAWELLQKEGGEIGKKKLKLYTNIATILIAILQAAGYYFIMRKYGILAETTLPDLLTGTVIILCLIVGALFLTWLGDTVEKRGIGNGISIILFAGIISRLPSMLYSMYNGLDLWYQTTTGKVTQESLVAAGMTDESAAEYLSSGMPPWIAIAIIAGIAVLVLLIIWAQDVERRIPVQYASRRAGTMSSRAHRTFIPLKISMTGVLPIIFAQSVLALPATIWAFIGIPADGTTARKIYDQLANYSPWYIAVYAIMIFAFSYYYASIQCNPVEISRALQQSGGFIPGFRPGPTTTNIFVNALRYTTFFGAIYLAIVALSPLIAACINNQMSIAVGGTSVIIVVGVAIELSKVLETSLAAYNYRSLLDKK